MGELDASSRFIHRQLSSPHASPSCNCIATDLLTLPTVLTLELLRFLSSKL